jgi:radical SAM superfamily enzyme YgiQ (UPF0313 family)
MRVLLVQAYLGGGEQPVFPLGLGYLAAALKGHDVSAYDPNVSADPYGGLARAIADHAPEVVGVSLRNIDSTNKRQVVFYYDEFKRMLAFMRPLLAEGCRVVVGGSGFSMYAKRIMADEPLIDLGVYLEGERTLPELLANLDRPETVQGVYYRREGEVLFSGHRMVLEMRDAILPERAVLGIAPYRDIPDAVGVETKRGCELNCIYCIYGFLNGKRTRLKRPGAVVDDIEALVRQGATSFTFVDSIFNHPADHAAAICREMIARKVSIPWSAWFSEKHITADFMRLAREAGCTKAILSPDGFSDESLRLLGKEFTKRDILDAFDILAATEGVEITFNFFKNPPGQTLGTFLDMVLFYFRAKKRLGGRVHFEYNSLRIEPHTMLYKIAVEEGVIGKDDDLLKPRYYTQRGTAYIEMLFNLMLRAKGR